MADDRKKSPNHSTRNTALPLPKNSSQDEVDAFLARGKNSSSNEVDAFVNTLHIDHTEVQVAWTGGNIPTSGGSSGYDTYAFNIIKTADAAYAVIGNQVKTS